MSNAGASVVIADLPQSDGEAVAKEIGENVHFVAADVTAPERINAVFDGAEGLGTLKVDVNPHSYIGKSR